MNYLKVLSKMRKVSEPYKEKKKKWACWADYMKYRNSRMCVYNGEMISYAALSMRFKRSGESHPCRKASEYLINVNENQESD